MRPCHQQHVVNYGNRYKQMDNQQYLPSLTLYRRNCHAYARKYLAYLSSTTEILLLQFTSTGKVAHCTNIKIPLEPVKAITIKMYQEKVYIAVAFISRFLVFCGQDEYGLNQLALDKNIVNYQNGYIAVCEFEDGFAFLRRKGEVNLFIISNRETTKILPSQLSTCYSSIAYLSSMFYLGTETGQVKTMKVETDSKQCKQLKVFDTTSTLPIFYIIPCPSTDELYVSTCEGELYILSTLNATISTIAIHRSMIARMMIHGNLLYTAGEDGVINKLEILGNCKVKLVETRNSDRLVSMLLVINGKPYLSYYENPVLKPLF